MKWVQAAAIWYFIGLLCFYHIADYQIKAWATAYYLWDKGKDVLFAAAIWSLNKRVIGFKAILIFSIIRFLWEITVAVTGWNENKILTWLFAVFLFLWIYPAIKNGWQWLKQNF